MARTKPFNPLASKGKGDYDDEGAKATGIKVPKGQHGFSLDPRSGKVLKSRGHPSFRRTRQNEELRDADLKFEKGRYYSKPRKKKLSDTLPNLKSPKRTQGMAKKLKEGRPARIRKEVTSAAKKRK